VIVLFSVTDTGIGISETQLQRIFSPFEQGDESRLRNRRGTGLGLSISRQLVQLMNGRIWVESKVGGDSLFRFTGRFGASKSADVGTTDVDTIGVLPTAAVLTAAPRRPLRVLLAGDNPINQRLVQLILAERGHRVDIVPSGEAALGRIRQSTYDVCPDLPRPGMDEYLTKPFQPDELLLLLENLGQS